MEIACTFERATSRLENSSSHISGYKASTLSSLRASLKTGFLPPVLPRGHSSAVFGGKGAKRVVCRPGERSKQRQLQARSSMASPALGADPIREWIMSEGGATRITRVTPVSGGCINVANKYETDKGAFFVKSNRDTGPAMFEAEAAGLEAIFETQTIRAPRPFKVGSLPGRGSFIIMEFIEFGSSRGQAEFGRQLGLLHKQGTTCKGFGFDMDNTIGSTHQPNPWTSDWVEFFREHRLGYQLSLAKQQYRDNEIYQKGQQLLERLPELLGGVEVRPALLHGDLWTGNVTADSSGAPVILDPATYYGHSEAEFGMSWCASFSPQFWKAYHEIIPREPGFETRVELYKLYHYLNHYNLFGSGYRGSCTSIISRFI